MYAGFAGKIGLMSFALLFISFVSASQVSAAIVINEIYGAGGNAGANLNQDFVELYNNGATNVDISGYSLQYNAASGTTGNYTVCALPATGDTIIEPGTYFLVGTSAPGANGSALNPQPNFNCAVSLNIAATAGKVALVSSTAALAATATCAANLAASVDYVGFGTTANCFEGTAAAQSPSLTTSIQRTPLGSDTNNNSTDFTSGAQTPMAANIATAASVNLGGQVLTVAGTGIGRALVTLTGGNLQNPLYAQTDLNGNYNFSDVEVGATYVLTVRAKGFSFTQTNLIINLNEDYTNANFTSTSKQRIRIIR